MEFDKRVLDRHITGNYGEDQFRGRQTEELEELREAFHAAKRKMLTEQERDPNCVWAEFEALIWAVGEALGESDS